MSKVTPEVVQLVDNVFGIEASKKESYSFRLKEDESIVLDAVISWRIEKGFSKDKADCLRQIVHVALLGGDAGFNLPTIKEVKYHCDKFPDYIDKLLNNIERVVNGENTNVNEIEDNPDETVNENTDDVINDDKTLNGTADEEI